MRWIALLLALAACPAHHKPIVTPPQPPQPEAYSWKRVETAADLPKDPPAPGTYRVHLIDVGTGLSILIQGADFAMLYDAGTNDKEESPSRVIAYLTAALGPSGDDDLCGDPPPHASHTIDHVVLSHPHFDHGSALDTVLHCYPVKQFWDSGRVNDTVFYRELVSVIGRDKGLTYHTAADVPADHMVAIKGTEIHIAEWQRFSEGDVVELGAGAKFTILHAEGKKVQDINENSTVLRVELGGTTLLLVGDSPSGSREAPDAPVGAVEQFLVEQHAKDLHVDILQVGHHGSKTSSRHGFLSAVAPRLALVSSGPKVYGNTVLPDHEVLEELVRVGATVLRTDERDGDCPVHGRIGGDHGPGGCDSWLITIGAHGK